MSEPEEIEDEGPSIGFIGFVCCVLALIGGGAWFAETHYSRPEKHLGYFTIRGRQGNTYLLERADGWQWMATFDLPAGVQIGVGSIFQDAVYVDGEHHESPAHLVRFIPKRAEPGTSSYVCAIRASDGAANVPGCSLVTPTHVP